MPSKNLFILFKNLRTCFYSLKSEVRSPMPIDKKDILTLLCYGQLT
jgi:hypothetical protein